MIQLQRATTTATEKPTPELSLRVPGPWQSIRELRRRLPAGHRVFLDRLHLADGQSVALQVRPADDELAGLFRTAASTRLTAHEFDRISHAECQLGLQTSTPGLAAVRRIVRAASALLSAGGAGVFLDTGARAHTPLIWSIIDRDRSEPAALLWAFVAVVHGQQWFHSTGMHVFGHPDARLRPSGNPQQDAEDLNDFLTYLLIGEREVADGHFVSSDENTPAYKLRAVPDLRTPPFHPMWNTYGLWELQRGPSA